MTAGREHSGTFRIGLLTTGGTIEKTYDAHQGKLHNVSSVLDHLLGELVLEAVQLERIPVMSKDSLDMTSEDHHEIAKAAIDQASGCDGVVIVHGTDRLANTGEAIHELAGQGLKVPVVLTGSMRPWVMRDSDAQQNLTESLLAVQLLEAGVYVCMHSRILRFPGVIKDRKNLRFVMAEELVEPSIVDQEEECSSTS